MIEVCNLSIEASFKLQVKISISLERNIQS